MELLMATDNEPNETVKTDLSQIPTGLLKAELERRKPIERAERERAAYEKACCKNCAYRIYSRSWSLSTMYEETWVCLKRPKRVPNKVPFGRLPEYNKAYYVCGYKYDGCEMFLHRDTPEGQEIVKANQTMALRGIE